MANYPSSSTHGFELNVLFVQLYKTLENTGKHWKTLTNTRKHWKTLENTGKHWKTLKNTGKHWKTLENTGKHWKTLLPTDFSCVWSDWLQYRYCHWFFLNIVGNATKLFMYNFFMPEIKLALFCALFCVLCMCIYIMVISRIVLPCCFWMSQTPECLCRVKWL